MIKRLVCLANSRKLHGRCIAGRELLEETPADGFDLLVIENTRKSQNTNDNTKMAATPAY